VEGGLRVEADERVAAAASYDRRAPALFHSGTALNEIVLVPTDSIASIVRG
jgi:hypothetical protein